ncbi:SDR family NAD(P)-dependent oxidoreductase [Rhodohalobacter sp. 8-1]|uniref:SDR family NAD(P)-dependent oxidoreductase n=1 Tax=Rhodohalobacter sp. 8-1 TaxID=3131972 RepID=UPI0030EC173F
MNLKLKGKHAIVTGASKGIGKGIAQSLAEEGCNVSICARTQSELQSATDELRQTGADILAIQADLTRDDDIEKVVTKTADAFGSIDILVNNAGTIGQSGTFEGTPLDEWRSLFELNVFAVVSITRKVIPYMKKQGWGRIINISSENGTQPYPDMIHYSASKGALDNFSKALSKQYAEQNILVNTVSPAFIMTPLVSNMMEKAADEQGVSKEEAIESFLENNRPHIEQKRPGTIDEVGPVVAFLASDKASFINGSNFRVDGGSVASV